MAHVYEWCEFFVWDVILIHNKTQNGISHNCNLLHSLNIFTGTFCLLLFLWITFCDAVDLVCFQEIKLESPLYLNLSCLYNNQIWSQIIQQGDECVDFDGWQMKHFGIKVYYYSILSVYVVGGSQNLFLYFWNIWMSL